MTFVRCVAARAVLFPVPAPLWTLGCVIQVLAVLSRVVTRWGAGCARLGGAG